MDTKDQANTEIIRSKVSMVFQNPEDQIVASVVEEDTAFAPRTWTVVRGDQDKGKRGTYGDRSVGEEKARRLIPLGRTEAEACLAGVLAIRPGALLLDEAMSMLDPLPETFLDLVRKEHDSGRTVVQVTHRLDETVLSDRTVIVADGKIHGRAQQKEFLSLEESRLRRWGLRSLRSPCSGKTVKNGILPRLQSPI
jgi:energy-coupling factor transport system ATP-binding protein